MSGLFSLDDGSCDAVELMYEDDYVPSGNDDEQLMETDESTDESSDESNDGWSEGEESGYSSEENNFEIVQIYEIIIRNNNANDDNADIY